MKISTIANIFKIHRDERWLTIVSTVVFALLNALTVIKYYGSFSLLANNYHRLFVRTFKVSGFDPLTYAVLSQWDTEYNVYRHPLLAFFMWPFNQINQGLMMLTGMNLATIITAVILVVCSVYSCLFMFRIFKEIIALKRCEAYLLTLLTFSFAFVMLSAMVPDHFIMSMFALTLTLYVSGRKLCAGSALNMWETIGLFVLTAGISLNNGLKVFLAALMTRRKKFFRPGYILLAVIIPSALMWGFARWEYRTYVLPKELARHEKKMKKVRAEHEALKKELRDSLKFGEVMTAKDSAALTAAFKKENQRRAVAKYRRDHKQIWNKNTGKPIAKGEFMRWTDKTTSRWDVAVECLFGEGMILHEDHLLGDVLKNRPVIVRYNNWSKYVAEACIVLLFLVGIWYGRKQLFMWTAMSFFVMDMALHMGLGFGINEIYIMSAHYLFVIPIAMAYLFKGIAGGMIKKCVTGVVGCLTACLLFWNVTLIIEYML